MTYFRLIFGCYFQDVTKILGKYSVYTATPNNTIKPSLQSGNYVILEDTVLGFAF